MSLKHRMHMGIVMALTIAILTSCGGPEQKKAKFYNRGKALYEKGEYVKAILEFKNAIQIDVGYADAYYMLGMVALKAQDHRGAYASFSKVVELSPQHWGAQIQLGRFLLGAGEVDKAMDKAELVLKGEANNEDALILKGAVLLKKKHIEDARRFLESVVGREVHKPDGYLLLTSIYAQKGDTLSAEKTLREGIKLNGESASLYLSLADLYLKKKRTDEVVGLMQKVIEIEPNITEYRLALAGIYWDSGKEQQATEVLKMLLSTGQKNDELWVRVSDFYSLRNRPVDAEQQLKEGIRRNGKSFQIRFALSALYFSTGRPDQGVSILQECLGLEKAPANPNIIRAKNSLAQFYLTRREVDKAKQYADEVIRVSPKNVDAIYIDGTIHLGKHEGVQAITSFRTVINERPQFIPGYISLADAHAMNKEMNLAFDTLQNALKIAPGSRDVIRAMARLYAGQKHFRDAELQYRKVLGANPEDLEVRAELGDLMLRAGDFKRAEGEYADIKRRAPNNPLGYIKLSASFMAQQKWDRAVAELEKVLQIQPDLWNQMNDLAYLLGDYGHGKKDLDRALALAQKADSLSPENPSVFDTLGWIHYRRGELNQAIELLGKAQARNAANPVVNFHLGMAHYRAGNSEKAKEYLKSALSSEVSFPGMNEAKKVIAGLH